MRIAVNMLSLIPGQTGGVGVYLMNLLRVLQRNETEDRVILFLPGGPRQLSEVDVEELFTPRGGGQESKGDRPNPPALARRLWQQLPDPVRQWTKRLLKDRVLRQQVYDTRVDVWFCPQALIDPRGLGIPTVAFIPDAQHEFYPEFFPHWELRNRRREYARTCREATAIITISEHARSTLLQCYRAQPERVVVIPLAPAPEYLEMAPPNAVERVCRRYGLEPGYLFYPANTWKHKNHAALVHGLALVRKRMGQTPQCALVGWEHAGETALREAVAAFGLEREVIRLGYVPSADMPALYRGASALVFPSLFEGFGMPLLEAMAQGCPVACAKTTSIPEVVGDAAILFDPTQPEDIAAAITCVLESSEAREGLVRKGLARAAQFSWTRAASRTMAVVENAVRAQSAVRT